MTENTKQVATGAVLMSAVFLYFFFLAPFSHIADPDALYHVKMILMTMRGAVSTAFPWAWYTVLRTQFADHQWLYHALGVPTAALFGPITGYRVYNALLAAVSMEVLYGLLRLQRVRYPLLWVLMLFTSPLFIFRMAAGKVLALSLIWLCAGVYAVTARKYIFAALITALYALSYGGFILLPVAAALYLIVRGAHSAIVVYGHEHSCARTVVAFIQKCFDRASLLSAASVIIGAAVGLLLHPQRTAILPFLYTQIVRIGSGATAVASGAGMEWLPVSPMTVFTAALLVMIIFCAACAVYVGNWKKYDELPLFWIIFSFMLVLAGTRSIRYLEYAIPAMLFASAQILGQFEIRLRTPFLISVAGVLALWCVLAGGVVRTTEQHSPLVTRLQGVSAWLAAHTPADSIICNTRWDDFSYLWYYNDRNRYIVGLDPQFMYLYDRQLLGTYRSLGAGEVSDSAATIVNNFGAAYVVVPADYPKLGERLAVDSRARAVYTDSDATIYELR